MKNFLTKITAIAITLIVLFSCYNNDGFDDKQVLNKITLEKVLRESSMLNSYIHISLRNINNMGCLSLQEKLELSIAGEAFINADFSSKQNQEKFSNILERFGIDYSSYIILDDLKTELEENYLFENDDFYSVIINVLEEKLTSSRNKGRQVQTEDLVTCIIMCEVNSVIWGQKWKKFGQEYAALAETSYYVGCVAGCDY